MRIFTTLSSVTGPWITGGAIPTNRAVYWHSTSGKKAHYIERYGHYSPSIRSGVIALLSATGRDALRNQLRSFAETFEPVIFCSFDLCFERFVLRNISRQIHYGIFLGWIEEIDVESPVFHQAPWRWYPSTHPADRYHDRAIQSLYQTIGRGLADIPDFGTGKPVGLLPRQVPGTGVMRSGFRQLAPPDAVYGDFSMGRHSHHRYLGDRILTARFASPASSRRFRKDWLRYRKTRFSTGMLFLRLWGRI